MVYKPTVEVPMFLCYFTFLLIGNIMVNLVTYKVCYNILDYPEANCSRLGRDTDNATVELERIVQPHSGTVVSVTEMLPGSIPVVLAIFIGSWSDKYGRKPVLLVVLIYIMLSFLLSTIMLLFKGLNPWLLILGSTPIMICGGVTTLFSVILAYLNDISTAESRAMRMATFEVVQIAASLLGGLSSSYILYATNYATVYGIGTVLVGCSVVYTYFCVPESLKEISDEKPSLSSIFTCNNLTDLFRVAGRKREHNKRRIVLLVIFALIIINFFSVGETTVKTMYLRNIFSWTLTERNTFGAIVNVTGIISTILSTKFLHDKLRIREGILITSSLISLVGASFLYAIANNNAYIYSTVVVGMLSGLGTPMLRTILTKIIIPSEMGKIFSLIMVINSISMLISSLAYQMIYNETIDTHPEAFNYVSMGLELIVLITAIILIVLESRVPKIMAKSAEANNNQYNEKSAEANKNQDNEKSAEENNN